MSELIRLTELGLVTKPTQDALFPRLERPERREPSYFDEPTFMILIGLCGRLRPPYPRPTALEIALKIDARLAKGEGNGWRYDALPPDGDAYARGLRLLDAESFARHERAFLTLAPGDQDELIRAVQREDTRADWSGVAPKRLLEELHAEVVTHAYAHPDAQEAIRYVGYADVRGWKRVGPNQKEEWEA